MDVDLEYRAARHAAMPVPGGDDQLARPEVEAEHREDHGVDDAGFAVGELDRHALGAPEELAEERAPAVARSKRLRQPPRAPRPASAGDRLALAWAVSHVGRFTYNLGPPTDRGGSVRDMRSREPVGTTCDCSMFTRWAFAQAGIDIGLTTSTQWMANGLLPPGQTPQQTQLVTRGVGADPPAGGYQPGDLIFFGVDDGPNGHVALWLGKGMLVQCSASGNGSNIRPLAGYVAPTGWLRWNLG